MNESDRQEMRRAFERIQDVERSMGGNEVVEPDYEEEIETVTKKNYDSGIIP